MLTTYYAKRIIGDNAAANATSALLQTGDGIIANTWIFNQTQHTIQDNNNYGINYIYNSNGNDKLELFGGGASASIWAQLNSGDIYISGKVGINDVPSNNGNYYLNIQGSTASGATAAIVKIHSSIAATATVGTSQLALQNDGGGTVALEFIRDHNTSPAASWQIIAENANGYLCFKNNYSISNNIDVYNTYAAESLKLFSKGATINGSGAIPALSIGKNNNALVAPTDTLEVYGTGNITGNVSIGGKITSTSTLTQDVNGDWALDIPNGDIRANKIWNAVWNDYAEYRECEDLIPGTCVKENNNGCLTHTIARLTPGASIITDTFGYSQGKTEKANTPIAVSGRVLAYTYQPRENYQAGQAVCSAPNGTIDIMTRDEIRDYPDAIVGIVSEIPDYEIWGSGNIKVNNRIWIKIK